MRSCRQEAQQTHRHEINLRARDAEISSYRLSNGQLAVDKELLAVTVGELRDQVWIKDDSLKLLLRKLKDLSVAIRWKTRYVYDTLYLPFETPVVGEFQRNFSKSDQWFFLSGRVTQNGVNVDKLSIPNTQRLVVSYKKGKPLISVTNSNPFLRTEEITGQVIRVPEKRWVIGIGGNWNIYESPSAGFFMGYKLLEF